MLHPLLSGSGSGKPKVLPKICFFRRYQIKNVSNLYVTRHIENVRESDATDRLARGTSNYLFNILHKLESRPFPRKLIQFCELGSLDRQPIRLVMEEPNDHP